MTRVIHTGDTHVGYQQYHRPERRADFLRAFERVVADAVDAEVDAVVHAGDLFHDRRPDLQDILGTISTLRTLDDAGIPFLAVVGNHETKRDAQWLDLFETLGLATRLDAAPTVVGDTAFYGLDFVPRSQRDALTYDFDSHDADHAALVSHGLFQPFDYGDWDAREILEESGVAFDAMLLGDNHDPGRVEIEGTWVTYCGSTERASADEREDRGYNVVTFEDGASIARRGLPTREFVFVDVDLREGEGAERVRQRVGEHDLEDSVVIVTVDGEGERIAPATVESFAAESGALVARVTDHREFEDAADIEANFADPDEAVRERVRDLGLSAAARDIDETIRASKVADSNVAETVESRIEDLVEDPDAFARAEAAEGDGGEEGNDPAASTADDERTSGGDDAAERDVGPVANADDGTTTEDETGVDADSPSREDRPGETAPGDGQAADRPGEESPATAGADGEDGEDQTTWGDF
jgi:DNA repair exonuclease SbcCD nuclease subunit